MSGIVWLPPASVEQAQAELDELLGRVEYLRRVLRDGPHEIIPVSPLPSSIDWDQVEKVIGVRINRSGRPAGVYVTRSAESEIVREVVDQPETDLLSTEGQEVDRDRQIPEVRVGVDLEGHSPCRCLGTVPDSLADQISPSLHGGSPIDSSGAGTPGAEGASSDSPIVASDGDSGPGPSSNPADGPLSPASPRVGELTLSELVDLVVDELDSRRRKHWAAFAALSAAGLGRGGQR